MKQQSLRAPLLQQRHSEHTLEHLFMIITHNNSGGRPLFFAGGALHIKVVKVCINGFS